MIRTITHLLCVALLVFGVAAFGEDAQITLDGPTVDQLAEGREYVISWESSGVDQVTIVARGDLLSLPGSTVKQFSETVAESVPSDQGRVTWTVPYLDTVRFRIDISGHDEDGELVAETFQVYNFRPAVLRTRTANGIYIDLRNPARQRLYRLHGNVVTHAYITSGSRTGVFLPKTSDSSKPHDHVGVFRVTQKDPMYWSREYSVWMTHAMRFWKGHFIHGTYPDQYYLLGRPASSGCVRLHRTDAEELFRLTSMGTRVEVFG